ncbi:MAG: hypothetical protein QOK00_2340 [Thermoleophilaceae bacterium]|nr:hypothetical protein [Thermoleophilaceae bacterium]MEA2401937.1 hypothetical protein [Thermoleophilaceae bacterium]
MPTVAVHTETFARLARSAARVKGMPGTRQAFVPQPLIGLSPDELFDYIVGGDPVNGRPFMQEVIEGLTRPLDARDQKGVSFDRSAPRLLEPDSEDNLQQLFMDNAWTDYMPIVLPTEERVAAMLAGTSRSPDDRVGRMRPTLYREFWEFNVEKVAVNAVMAGARPEYLPVILAIAAAGVTARQSSTTSLAAITLVNGPIRNEIGMNYGIGAFGPYNHANVTIGRAHGLLSQNLQGGSVPGETYMGSQGSPWTFSAAYAENEEASPWEPFHVQHGFQASDSTVSVFTGGWYNQWGTGIRDEWEEKFRASLRACEPWLGPMLALDPLAARELVKRGFDTKAKLLDWLVDNARMTAREYWDNQWSQTALRPFAALGEEPYASILKADPDELIKMYRPEDISVTVIGGETTPTWNMLCATLENGTTLVDAVNRGIASVDDWR